MSPRPLDLPDLPNLADQWALQGGLRRVQAPAYLKMLRSPTVEGFRSEIFNGYDIVHFDGHGALPALVRPPVGLGRRREEQCPSSYWRGAALGLAGGHRARPLWFLQLPE